MAGSRRSNDINTRLCLFFNVLGRCLHVGAPSSLAAAAAKSIQSYLTLYEPIDGSPPGSSVLGILQARILERVAISFSNACMHAKALHSCPTLQAALGLSFPSMGCLHGKKPCFPVAPADVLNRVSLHWLDLVPIYEPVTIPRGIGHCINSRGLP